MGCFVDTLNQKGDICKNTADAVLTKHTQWNHKSHEWHSHMKNGWDDQIWKEWENRDIEAWYEWWYSAKSQMSHICEEILAIKWWSYYDMREQQQLENGGNKTRWVVGDVMGSFTDMEATWKRV